MTLLALDPDGDTLTYSAVNLPPAYNRLPHSFTHIFAGGYAAGYYGYLWADVLTSDAAEAFAVHVSARR